MSCPRLTPKVSAKYYKMGKIHFVFTKLPSSFSVHVKNMEELSVKEIQNIERFVKDRKGIFDFESYKFVIQKRLEFDEFVRLAKNSFADVTCQENIKDDIKYPRIDFGKYKGMFFRDLTDSYILWLKSNYRGKYTDIIESEINIRHL